MTYKGLYDIHATPVDGQIDWYIKPVERNNIIVFQAVDKQGKAIKSGNIFSISIVDGRIYISSYYAINKNLGLELNGAGKSTITVADIW